MASKPNRHTRPAHLRFVAFAATIIGIVLLTALGSATDDFQKRITSAIRQAISPMDANAAAPPMPWPHSVSDLKPDPGVVFGQLSNGFRYALIENHRPEDRVSLHLNIMAGSFHETEAQRGIAHFLEHMMFNGTTHFPPGELVKYFQAIGMQFGPDANARTGFSETVYDILLPSGEDAELENALGVLRDYADGALLSGEEIERERRVILAEKRSRDSAGYRTFEAELKFAFPEARISSRLPIGLESVIRSASRDTLKAYYDAWYRPDNMILVMVGDFDPRAAAVLIGKAFDSLSRRAVPPVEPDFGSIDHHGIRVFHHFEEEEGRTGVTIEVIEKVAKRPDSRQLQKMLLIENVANRIVQNRLDARLHVSGTPYTEASIGSGLFLHQGKVGSIQAECKPENWRETLAAIEQTLRRALVYGFSPAELARVRKEVLSELENAVREASTRESPDLARALIRHLNADRVFLSPLQEQELFAPWVEALTVADVNRGFRDIWKADHRLVLVTGNADLSSGERKPETQIRSVYQASSAAAVSAIADHEQPMFPYLPEPSAGGRVIQRRILSDLGVTQIDFENGVRLNVKPTTFKANEVLAVVCFGYGDASQPPGKPGLADLAVDVVNESGLGGLTRDQLDRALTGRSTDVRFTMAQDRFMLSGRTVRHEVRLLFQLFHTFIKDPGFRSEAHHLVMERFRQQYRELSRSTDGTMILAGDRFLAGGDERFGLPPLQTFGRLRLEDIRDWIEPSLGRAVLEVSIVGDVDVATVADLAGRYVGSLSLQRPVADPDVSGGPAFPAGGMLEHRILTDIDKGLVVVAYPTEDLWDIRRTRRLNVLGSVFSDRLRERIREKLGAAYSPFAYNRPSRAYAGYGVFQAMIQTAPDESRRVMDEVRSIAAELGATGVSAEMLKRALEPTTTGIKDLVRTNGYWLNTVLAGSLRHPEQLEWARTITSDYAAISAQELTELAGLYLDNRKAATILALPAEGPAIGKDAPP